MQEQPLRTSLLRASGLLIGCLSLGAAAFAVPAQQEPTQQEGAVNQGNPEPHFPSKQEILGAGPGQASPQQRMRELFLRVEGNLHAIDRLLGDAAAGDTSSLSAVQDAGIAELLKNSLERGREAQSKILEIIELAKQQSAAPSSSSKSGQGKPSGSGSGGSPLDRGQQSQSSEQTPQMGKQGPGQQPQDGKQPGGQQPDQKAGGQQPKENEQGSDPKQDGKSGAEGQNREGDQNADGRGGAARNNAQAADGWGNLPSHVRETFNSAGRSELPARYRDWIDDYYRKLNRRSDH